MPGSDALPYDYVVSDMDGTLIRPDHRMSALTRNVLSSLLLDKHVTLILATGRNHFDIRIIGDHLRRHVAEQARLRGAGPAASSAPVELSNFPFYMITSNGAVIHNATTNQMVSQRCVDPVVAEKLYRLLPESEEGINTNVYQYDDWYCRLDWKEVEEHHKESGLRYKLCPNPPHASAGADCNGSNSGRKGVNDGCFEGITKVFFIVRDRAQMARATALVREALGSSVVSLTYSAEYCMDIMAAGVTKGTAVQEVLRLIGKGPSDAEVAACLKRTIAFGDGLNDKDMLLLAGKGCVMGNANPQLKEECPQLEMIASNADDGVAHKLCDVFGLEVSAQSPT